jgi:asparagine synthase (glutamine-hydrolysing)
MPGIVGIIGKGPSVGKRPELDLMVKCMLHEPAYNSGHLLEEKFGPTVGWTCHPGSFSDCQPIWNERRDVCLIFSGEHYADKTERERLKAAGHDCFQDNASYLVHLYEEHGMRFFEMLNGIFSGVLLDFREEKVFLFNDRYGLNRIYYHEGADGFYFASEAKPLLKVLPRLRQLDQQGLGEFFACGCALQNRTLFSGISLLPGGSCWTFQPGREIRKECYFNSQTWENQQPLSSGEYYEKLKAALNRVVPRYFDGAQPVALSLTGGLDSRMILAALRPPPGTLPCYTFGGIYRECEDVRVSRQVAKVCQQNHQTILLGPQFFAEFPRLAERSVYITDGAMDVTGAIGLFVNRAAKDIAPVRMTGNYGGEILRGYVALKAGSVCESMFDPQFMPRLSQARETFQAQRNQLRTSFIAFKQVPWHHFGHLALENSQLTIRSPYLDNELVALAYQAAVEPSANKELALRYIAENSPALGAIPTDRGMAKRPRLVPVGMWDWWKEFFPRAEYVYDYGMPQWLAKIDRVLSPLHFEKLFLGRQKFYHFRTWYRHELSQYVKSVLLDPRTLSRSYLNGRKVGEMVNAHVRGSGNYTLEIHKLLTSEIIQRQLIEKG